MENEQEIGKVQSAVGAKRILEEIAVAGGYIAAGFSDGFVVYSKTKNDITEEINARKFGERDFRIMKKVVSKGGEKCR